MQLKKNLKKMAIVLAVSLLIWGCDDGGSDGKSAPNSSSPFGIGTEINDISQLAGDYLLIDFQIEYRDGTTIAPEDCASFSGSMRIEADGDVTQTIEINGYSTTLFSSVEINITNVWHIEIPGCSYDLSTTYIDDILTTVFPMGACDIQYTETDVWERQTTSKSAASYNAGDPDEQTTVGGGAGSAIDTD